MMIKMPRANGTNLCMIALLVSCLIQFSLFARWPGNPDWDVHHSVFAAENFVATGSPLSINLYPDRTDDLSAHTRLRWMTQWPPVHSWLYAAPMTLGLSAGVTTKILALLSIVIGGLGCAFLARALGGSIFVTAAVAAAYPWLSLMAKIYLDYKNDHWACAVAPWIFLTVLQIQPLKVTTRENWGKLLAAAFLAGFSILLKYSLNPFIIASGLYLLWLDGLDTSRRRIYRLFGWGLAVILPCALFWLFIKLHEVALPTEPGGGLHLSLLAYAKNFITNTAGAFGYNLLLTQLTLFMGKHFGAGLPKGSLLAVSAIVTVIVLVYFRRNGFQGPRKSFAIFLGILTVSLWMMLSIMTAQSGYNNNYVSDMRFYLPVSLGWLILLCVCLSVDPRKGLLWGAALLSVAVPAVFSFVFFSLSGLTNEPFVPMPRSGVAWIESDPVRTGQPDCLARQDPAHAAFLANLVSKRGRRPDLLVATEGRFLTELGVPVYYTFKATADDGHVYYSSRNIEVWAMIPPDDKSILLSKFRRASTIDPVETPAGFPFLVYVMKFAARSGSRL